MLIKVSMYDIDREFTVLNRAFTKAWETEDQIIGHLNLIQLRPDSTILTGSILKAAKDQNN